MMKKLKFEIELSEKLYNLLNEGSLLMENVTLEEHIISKIYPSDLHKEIETIVASEEENEDNKKLKKLWYEVVK